MKAKRILSTIIAAMLLASSIAVSAGAETTAQTNANTLPTIDSDASVSLTITLLRAGSGDTTADDANSFSHVVEAGINGDAGVANYARIANSTFKIYTDTNKNGILDGTEGEAVPVSTITTNENGVAVVDGDSGEDTTINDDEDNVIATTYDYNENLTQGRYIVVNSGLGVNQSSCVANFAVDLPMTDPENDGWIYDVNVYPKLSLDTKPSVDKQVRGSDYIVDGSGNATQEKEEYADSASIDVIGGELAEWKITATVPTDIATYKKFTINDTIDTSELQPVYVDNGGYADMTATNVASAVTVKAYDASNGAINVPTNTISYNPATGTIQVDFTADGSGNMSALNGVATITVEFSTKLIKTGVKLANDAEVIYRNSSWKDADEGDPNDPNDDTPADPDGKVDNNGGDPDDDPTPETPKDPEDGTKADPYVYTGKIDVTKIEKGDESKTLADVEFALYDENKNPVVDASTSLPVKAKTAANGTFTFEGLENGTYYLLETKTIAGYELIGEYIPFYVYEGNFSDVELSTTDKTNIAYHTEDGDGNLLVNFIQNTPSTKLPLTGGMGTTMFALAGMVFVTAGGTFFFKKSKKDEVAE